MRGITLKLPLICYQSDAIKIILRTSLGAIKKRSLSFTDKDLSSTSQIVPQKHIVDAYHTYLGKEYKYKQEIAPHLFPQWSFPSLFNLLKKLNLPLHKILNQGCELEIFDRIPRDSFRAEFKVYAPKKEETKIKIEQEIQCISSQNTKLLSAKVFATIPLKSSKKKKHYSTENRKYHYIIPHAFSSSNAKSFALVTGDFNPIHLSQLMAKAFGFKSSIMHGFGILSYIFETIEDLDFQISKIRVLFLRPLYLNTKVNLKLSAPDNQNIISFEIESMDQETTHVSGYAILTSS